MIMSGHFSTESFKCINEILTEKNRDIEFASSTGVGLDTIAKAKL